MPRKKRANSEETGDRCGHVNRHYYGQGECVCALPKGHGGYHEGDYVDGNGEKMHGTWSDAAGEPVKENQ